MRWVKREHDDERGPQDANPTLWQCVKPLAARAVRIELRIYGSLRWAIARPHAAGPEGMHARGKVIDKGGEQEVTVPRLRVDVPREFVTPARHECGTHRHH